MKQRIIETGKKIIKLSNKATRIYNISTIWAFKAWNFRTTEIRALQEYQSNLIVDSNIDIRTI